MSTNDFVQSSALAEPPRATGLILRPHADRAAIARRRADQLAGFVTAARAAMADEDFDAATAACEEILLRDPDHEEALECLDRIAAILEERRVAAERAAQRLRLDAACAAIDGIIKIGAFKQALIRIDEVEFAEGAAPELDELRSRAAEGQRELEYRETVAAAVSEQVARAAQLLSSSNCQGALACLDAALSLDPAHPAAAALRLRLLESLQRLTEPVGLPDNPAPADVRLTAPVPTVDYESGLALFVSEDEPAIGETVSAERFDSDASNAEVAAFFELVRACDLADANPIADATMVAEVVSETALDQTTDAPIFVTPATHTPLPEVMTLPPRTAMSEALTAAPRRPVVVSVRWPGERFRVVLAAAPLVAAAVGGWVYWPLGRSPVMPVVAAAAIDQPMPAPLVADGPAIDLQPLAMLPAPAVAEKSVKPRTDPAPVQPRPTDAAAQRNAESLAAARSAAAEVAAAAADEQAVRAALENYAAAYAALDVNGIKRVFPSVNEGALRQSFAGLASQQVEIRDQQMAVVGDAATVSCTWLASGVAIASTPAPARDSRRTVFNLAKRNGNWVIVDRR